MEILFFLVIFVNYDSYPMDLLTSKKSLSLEEKAIEAIDCGNLEKLKSAIANGADIAHKDDCNNSLLMYAVINKKETIASFLAQHICFQQPEKVNQKNYVGQTILMAASHQGYDIIVKNLLNIQDIDINARDEEKGFTALRYAFNKKHYNIVKLLIDKNADSTVSDMCGETIAFYASIHTLPSDLKRRIINQTDSHGNTHLHLFAQSQLGESCRRSSQKIDILFSKVMMPEFMWVKNNDEELPIDKACAKYKKIKTQYNEENVYYLQRALYDQEQLFHLFLLYYAEDMKNKSITGVSLHALDLNIETEIANRYKDNKKHYKSDCCWQYKDQLREELRKDMSKIPTIWISGYIPPQILEEIRVPLIDIPK